MGQQERAREERSANKREKAKEKRGRRATSSGTYDLRGVHWVTMAALIVAFAEAGGALRVGLTRDLGALALGCYMDDDYATEYVRPQEDFLAAATEIAEAWLPDNGLAFHQAVNEFQRNAEPK